MVTNLPASICTFTSLTATNGPVGVCEHLREAGQLERSDHGSASFDRLARGLDGLASLSDSAGVRPDPTDARAAGATR